MYNISFERRFGSPAWSLNGIKLENDVICLSVGLSGLCILSTQTTLFPQNTQWKIKEGKILWLHGTFILLKIVSLSTTGKKFTHTTTQMIKCLLCIWLVLHRSLEDDYRFGLVVYRCPFSYVELFATEVLTNFSFQWQKLNHHDLIISSSPSIIQAKNDTIRDRGIIFIFLASKRGWFAWNFQFVDKKLR